MALSQPQLVDLKNKMDEYFNTNEIETLCFDLGIDYENLSGEGKSAKIRELIEYCRRQDRLDELVARVRAERPKVAWPGTPAAQAAAPQTSGGGAAMANNNIGAPPQPKPEPPQPEPKPAKKITILFLSANPKGTDRLRLDEEVRTIDERLRLAQHRDKFNLEQQFAVRTRDILDAMLRYQPDIVHFSGHGSADGSLIFEDASGAATAVSATALGALFQALEGVRCVVMNACWSDKHAVQIAKFVDCVIGMSRSVSDEAAIGFAAGFYRSLGEGKNVEAAFNLGTVQILLDGGNEQQTPRLKSRRGVNPQKIAFA
jgi:hypothetical protein